MAAARVFKVEFRIAVAQRILNGESVSDPEGAQIAGNLDSVRRALEAIIRCGFFTIRTSPAALSIYLSIDSFFGPPVSEIDLPTSLKASNSDFGISFNLTSQENVDAGGSSDLLHNRLEFKLTIVLLGRQGTIRVEGSPRPADRAQSGSQTSNPIESL